MVVLFCKKLPQLWLFVGIVAYKNGKKTSL